MREISSIVSFRRSTSLPEEQHARSTQRCIDACRQQFQALGRGSPEVAALEAAMLGIATLTDFALFLLS
jgi:hypothetical protein